MRKHIGQTYKVDLSLNNPRTVRLRRDAALKTRDYGLANSLDLRLVILGHDAANRNHKTRK